MTVLRLAGTRWKPYTPGVLLVCPIPTDSTLDPLRMSEPSRPDRRQWLRGNAAALSAAALAPAALARSAEAQPPSRQSRLGDLLNQLGQQATWRSPELRLVRRITMGLTEAEVTRAQALGYEAYLEEQLNPSQIDDRAMDTRVQATYGTLLSRTPKQLMDIDDAGTAYFDLHLPMRMLAADRAVASRRQLRERLYEFWADHFYVPVWGHRSLTVIHLEQHLRPNVLTTVGTLLRASMRSTAMLGYLDQIWSTRFGVNENYARELMELHTVGWDGGYTQADVAGLARVLTGWSMDANGNFEYKAGNHDFGAKTVFGLSFPARPQAFSGTSGLDEGMAFADMLVAHPQTKRFIATKLLRWFVTPTPTADQVQAVVNAYGADGDIKAMLRVVLSRTNLTRAPAKLKRPFHYAVSALRATGAAILPATDMRRDYLALVYPINDMGHSFANWPTPDAYPDRAEFWAGLIIDRWNAVNYNLVQTDNTAPGRAVVDVTPFVADGTANGVIAAINRRLFGGEMGAELAAELRTALRDGVTRARVLTAVRLAVCAPDFQFY